MVILSIIHELEDDKKLRNISELQIDVSKLLDVIESEKDKIEKISYKFDSEIIIKDIGSCDNLVESINKIGIETVEIIF